MDSDDIVRACRAAGRGSRPGIIKIEFKDVGTKVQALRRKRKLDDFSGHGRIFIRGAKSHVERLIDINSRTLLKEIPNGRQYRVAGNGRIIQRNTQQLPQHSSGNGATQSNYQG
jgi:hypothetical protein